ncbi:hypothetical protein FRACYDRAFT_250067 [Fragilariopsis cylindrus CCMP1102]|uniref:Uncharacterized protein n=1 Tax=Fragilariopsis cylindrus CCMP1102 TaxID=635003 RepID=A0A1E7EQM9_9STRA|nr:hypothetical protein FRACYDRAFT_250067 [Fragilariopsis cylindrus CCMP1102]|eukprot:OEU08278.1 hypothetical protein FRACYDRAFT_250067 [Fragilariopsis cylindrus CCMP1102]
MKLLQYSVLSVLGSTLLLSNGAVAALRGASSDAEDEDVAATSYRPVNIKNLTPYRATGVVSYASGPFKCSDDSYEVKPRPGEWTGPSRGICLVHQITATLHDVTGCDGDVQAKSYSSTGTAYDQFVVVEVGKCKFQATRLTDRALEEIGDNEDASTVAATSYARVNIKNLTPYRATGVVSYASGPFKCSDDSYEVKPRPGEWTGPSRGICLVHQITATLHDVTGCDGDVQAKSYSSTGTAYSQYVVVEVGKCKYQVTRLP